MCFHPNLPIGNYGVVKVNMVANQQQSPYVSDDNEDEDNNGMGDKTDGEMTG
jgi:hypothetical protein